MKRIFILVLSLTIVAALSIGISATEPSDDFTIDIGDLDLSHQGYLRMYADTPYGFSGSIIVEVVDAKGSKTTLEIRWKDHWTAGCWLPEGPCTIQKAYVLDSEDFLVDLASSSCTISSQYDTEIRINVLETPNTTNAEPNRIPNRETHSPSLSSTYPSESLSVTEATPDKTEPTGNDVTRVDRSEIHVSMILLSAASIFILVSVTRRKNKN